MFLACFGKAFSIFCLKLYGLPGGEQVDGLPPAASDKKFQTLLFIREFGPRFEQLHGMGLPRLFLGRQNLRRSSSVLASPTVPSRLPAVGMLSSVARMPWPRSICASLTRSSQLGGRWAETRITSVRKVEGGTHLDGSRLTSCTTARHDAGSSAAPSCVGAAPRCQHRWAQSGEAVDDGHDHYYFSV